MNKKNYVAIIDYELSNLHSVKSACEFAGMEAILTNKFSDILNSKAVVLPGVGAFNIAMNNIKNLKIDECLKEFLETKKPVLCICLGMQLLFDYSFEFGKYQGLGIIKGNVKKFDNQKINNINYPVPQIGWNKLKKTNNSFENDYLYNIKNNSFMYFVHSYYVQPDNQNIIVSTTNYGNIEYCSSLSYNNIFATQFHPEKSGKVGLQIYNNFKLSIKNNE